MSAIKNRDISDLYDASILRRNDVDSSTVGTNVGHEQRPLVIPRLETALANVNFQNIFLLLPASRIHQAEIEERLDLTEKYTKRRQDAIVLSKRRPLIIAVDTVEET